MKTYNINVIQYINFVLSKDNGQCLDSSSHRGDKFVLIRADRMKQAVSRPAADANGHLSPEVN